VAKIEKKMIGSTKVIALRDAIPPQVGQPDADQGPHYSRSSFRQVDEHRLEARA
jgi:hypothetical protein